MYVCKGIFSCMYIHLDAVVYRFKIILIKILIEYIYIYVKMC